MKAAFGVRLRELNPHLVCVLCGGYLINATTIQECLHSFCRSCILRYLESCSSCPICDVTVHQHRPHRNIREDKVLQNLVYKLVPGLFYRERDRRKDFFEEHSEEGRSEAGSSSNEELYGEEEQESVDFFSEPIHHDYPLAVDQSTTISVCVQLCDTGPPYRNSSSTSSPHTDGRTVDRRYLLCPARMPISSLKKFIQVKFQLSQQQEVDVYFSEEKLSDACRLMDIAYIYHWKRMEPLKLFYTVTRAPAIHITETSQSVSLPDKRTESICCTTSLKSEPEKIPKRSKSIESTSPKLEMSPLFKPEDTSPSPESVVKEQQSIDPKPKALDEISDCSDKPERDCKDTHSKADNNFPATQEKADSSSGLNASDNCAALNKPTEALPTNKANNKVNTMQLLPGQKPPNSNNTVGTPETTDSKTSRGGNLDKSGAISAMTKQQQILTASLRPTEGINTTMANRIGWAPSGKREDKSQEQPSRNLGDRVTQVFQQAVMSNQNSSSAHTTAHQSNATSKTSLIDTVQKDRCVSQKVNYIPKTSSVSVTQRAMPHTSSISVRPPTGMNHNTSQNVSLFSSVAGANVLVNTLSTDPNVFSTIGKVPNVFNNAVGRIRLIDNAKSSAENIFHITGTLKPVAFIAKPLNTVDKSKVIRSAGSLPQMKQIGNKSQMQLEGVKPRATIKVSATDLSVTKNTVLESLDINFNKNIIYQPNVSTTVSLNCSTDVGVQRIKPTTVPSKHETHTTAELQHESSVMTKNINTLSKPVPSISCSGTEVSIDLKGPSKGTPKSLNADASTTSNIPTTATGESVSRNSSSTTAAVIVLETKPESKTPSSSNSSSRSVEVQTEPESATPTSTDKPSISSTIPDPSSSPRSPDSSTEPLSSESKRRKGSVSLFAKKYRSPSKLSKLQNKNYSIPTKDTKERFRKKAMRGSVDPYSFGTDESLIRQKDEPVSSEPATASTERGYEQPQTPPTEEGNRNALEFLEDYVNLVHHEKDQTRLKFMLNRQPVQRPLIHSSTEEPNVRSSLDVSVEGSLRPVSTVSSSVTKMSSSLIPLKDIASANAALQGRISRDTNIQSITGKYMRKNVDELHRLCAADDTQKKTFNTQKQIEPPPRDKLVKQIPADREKTDKPIQEHSVISSSSEAKQHRKERRIPPLKLKLQSPEQKSRKRTSSEKSVASDPRSPAKKDQPRIFLRISKANIPQLQRSVSADYSTARIKSHTEFAQPAPKKQKQEQLLKEGPTDKVPQKTVTKATSIDDQTLPSARGCSNIAETNIAYDSANREGVDTNLNKSKNCTKDATGQSEEYKVKKDVYSENIRLTSQTTPTKYITQSRTCPMSTLSDAKQDTTQVLSTTAHTKKKSGYNRSFSVEANFTFPYTSHMSKINAVKEEFNRQLPQSGLELLSRASEKFSPIPETLDKEPVYPEMLQRDRKAAESIAKEDKGMTEKILHNTESKQTTIAETLDQKMHSKESNKEIPAFSYFSTATVLDKDKQTDSKMIKNVQEEQIQAKRSPVKRSPLPAMRQQSQRSVPICTSTKSTPLSQAYPSTAINTPTTGSIITSTVTSTVSSIHKTVPPLMSMNSPIMTLSGVYMGARHMLPPHIAYQGLLYPVSGVVMIDNRAPRAPLVAKKSTSENKPDVQTNRPNRPPFSSHRNTAITEDTRQIPRSNSQINVTATNVHLPVHTHASFAPPPSIPSKVVPPNFAPVLFPYNPTTKSVSKDGSPTKRPKFDVIDNQRQTAPTGIDINDKVPIRHEYPSKTSQSLSIPQDVSQRDLYQRNLSRLSQNSHNVGLMNAIGNERRSFTYASESISTTSAGSPSSSAYSMASISTTGGGRSSHAYNAESISSTSAGRSSFAYNAPVAMNTSNAGQNTLTYSAPGQITSSTSGRSSFTYSAPHTLMDAHSIYSSLLLANQLRNSHVANMADLNRERDKKANGYDAPLALTTKKTSS